MIGELVNLFQSAFIPRRQLVDSTVPAGEITKSWKRRGSRGFMWKVDFTKAYDSLDWNFLWSSFQKRGFPKVWVSRVKRCITSHPFSVLMNGHSEGRWIQLQRGIRHGCLLAPLLFVLAKDSLAICTNQVCMHGLLKGFQMPSYPTSIPLLQCADDTTFFSKGSRDEAKNISTLLDLFTNFSSLQINGAKQAFVGFRLSQEEEDQCSYALGTLKGTLPTCYLALLLMTGQLRRNDSQPVIEKVER